MTDRTSRQNEKRIVLLEHDFGRSLAEEPKAAVAASYDSAHRFAHRVERVHLVDLLLGTFVSHALVILAEVDDEAEKCTFRLVSHLLRQVTLVLRRLTHNTQTSAGILVSLINHSNN